MDVRVKEKEKRRCYSWDTQIKWWHLKNGKQSVFIEKILKQGCVKLHKNENDMWDKMSYEIKKSRKRETIRSNRFWT